MPDNTIVDNPFGALEPDQVTCEQYALAFHTLEEAAGKDVSKILILSSLSANFSLVGDDIKTLILGGGEIQTTSFKGPFRGKQNVSMVDRAWVIRKPVGDHEIVATTHGNVVSVEAYHIRDGQQLSLFNFSMPIHTEFRSTGNRLKDMMSLHATDWRDGHVVSYNPSVQPDNASIQQGFARIVQDGLRELLTVVTKP
jgi:hypothetical protein